MVGAVAERWMSGWLRRARGFADTEAKKLRPWRVLGVATVCFSIGMSPQESVAQMMALSGQFAVSAAGAATYSIPIAVPPGAAGMAPTLSLGYSSQSGDGIAGVGWSLGGLPSIGRCLRTLAQDGALGGVNYDSNDRFCMDGQRLVVVSGTYGADGAQYRTEIDTFSKIISHGTAGSGPAWFEVHTKAGQTMEFGNTTDSRILAQGKTSARNWALNKISDTKTNYFTVSYTNDTTNGQFYPIEINYAGNVGAAVSPPNKVQFFYATRPDIFTLYQAGSLLKTTVRLTNVKTFVGAALVTDYRLTYEQSGVLNRSRVTSVTACDAAGSCLPATNVSWTNVTAGFSTQQQWVAGYGVSVGWTNNNTYPRMLTDLNGDGLPDVVGFAASGVYASLNTGTSFVSQQQWISGFGVTEGWTNNDTYPRTLVDVNGDGLPDIVGFAASGVYVSLNTGTSFAARQQWVAGYGTSGGWADNHTFPRMLIDVNGDGRPDIVGIAAGGVFVSLNTGTSFGVAQQWIAGFGSTEGWNDMNTHPRMLADVNGDGLPDMVGFAGSGVYVALNTGTSFATRSQWVSGYGVGGGWTNNNDYPRMLVDVNGDGLPDIVGFAASGVYVSINTGTSFGTQQQWIVGYGITDGWANNDSYPRMLIDVNGDGLPDVVGFAASAVYVSLNTGTSFATRQQWISGYGVTGGWSDYPRTLVDIKGTGLAGIVGFAASAVYVSPNTANGPPPDLVASITSGLGAMTSVSYVPGTNSSVVTKGTGTTFPTLDLIAPMQVVSQVSTTNGIGGTYGSSYTYSGGRIDVRGRGFLGFAQTTVKDLQTNIIETTTYRQDFPYIGVASTNKKALNSLTLNQTTNTYQFSNASGAASVSTPNITSAPYRVSVSQSVAQGVDLDGSALPTVTTANQYDAYNNATQVVVSTPDGFSKTTANTYTNDTTLWYLGRLTRASVTSTAP